MQYYRVVFFDENHRFLKYEIIKMECVHDLLIYYKKHYASPYMEIYRCNKRGNNYTHRMIYPHPEVKPNSIEMILN